MPLAYDHPLVLNHQEPSSLPRSTLLILPTEHHFSRRSQGVCHAMPTYHERFNPFGTAGPTGVMSSWATPNISSPPDPPSVSSGRDCQDVQGSSPSVILLNAQPGRTTQLDSLTLSIPAHLDDCGSPTAVLGSRQKDTDSKAGSSPCLTTLETLPSRLPTSADQNTSMRAPRRRRDPVS